MLFEVQQVLRKDSYALPQSYPVRKIAAHISAHHDQCVQRRVALRFHEQENPGDAQQLDRNIPDGNTPKVLEAKPKPIDI